MYWIIWLLGLCLVNMLNAEEMGASMIDWGSIRNPVYGHSGWSVKDACVAFNGEHYVVFFSAFFHDRGRERSHVSAVQTKDFRSFSEPLFIWDGDSGGWTGFCSPNISRLDGEFILTFNSWGDEHPNGRENQLFYATSSDLINWSEYRPLASNLTEGTRAIDAALTKHTYYFLVWKERQTPQFAYARQLDGEWIRMDEPVLGWFENGQFLQIDGTDFLLFTGKGHQPYLVEIEFLENGDSTAIRTAVPMPLDIPVETFNTDDSANAAFMWLETGKEGTFHYLIYAGSTEGESHAGRGDNRLGIARSADGIHWSVPPE